MRHRFLTASAIVLAAASVYPQDLDFLAPYQAEKTVHGSIRNYGNNLVEPLLKRWEAGFRKHQPGVRFGDNPFERMVFQGGDKWNENLREYVDAPRVDAGDLMMSDLAKDRYGIAFSGMQFGRRFATQVKPIAIAAREGGAYVEPTRENFASRAYPLVRDINIYVNREPGMPLEPRLKEFLEVRPEPGGPVGRGARGKLSAAHCGGCPRTAQEDRVAGPGL